MIDYNTLLEEKNYIKIDLQFFAADGPGGEKTEQPTAKRKSDARKKGQVAKSIEVVTAFLFLGMFYVLKIFAKFMYERMAAIMEYSLVLISSINEGLLEIDYMSKLVPYIFGQIMFTVLPLFAVAMVVGIVGNLIQVGWKPTTEPLKPKFSRLNPLQGAKKLFSVKAIVELGKSLLKVLIIGVVIYNRVKEEMEHIQELLDMELLQAIIYIGNLVVDIGVLVGMYFIFIALVDYIYQRYENNKSLKMTKQEIKEEYKEAEGNPEIKGKIKQKMREASMRRMMQEVPSADVIITNPTHFAVALKYDREKSAAPIVIAKGADHLAKRIKEIAKENNVEIVENKYLARTLYATVDIGREIPPELYQAVAEVLAFVYNLKNKS